MSKDSSAIHYLKIFLKNKKKCQYGHDQYKNLSEYKKQRLAESRKKH